MQPTPSNDATPNTKSKESPTLEDTVDAELWLNLMTSMMNFAVASTNLMKAIQDKTGVSVVNTDEIRKPKETEEITTQPEEVKEEPCTIKTCDVLHQIEEVSEVPRIEEPKADEDSPPVTEDIPKENAPNTETPGDEIIEAEVPQSEASPENENFPESPEKTNEEQQEELPEDNDATKNTPDSEEKQEPLKSVQEKTHARKTCNIIYQEKEPYEALCSGACGTFPQSRIPVLIKKKKYKYSPESLKRLQTAKDEQAKPPMRPCGCRTEECEIKPCSCEDVTLCAPSAEPGLCICSYKTETTDAPKVDAPSPSLPVEEQIVQEKLPELLTAPTSQDVGSTIDQGVASMGEVAVQVTDAVSEMCYCDEQLLEEELLASEDDCECQTDPTESQQDFELSTISQHLQQTDENLQELRREVQRISDCISGRKRYADDVAAALYREIMKPRTSIVEVTGASHRMSPKRRDQVLEAFLELVLTSLDLSKAAGSGFILEKNFESD